jgi:hypothetical protein
MLSWSIYSFKKKPIKISAAFIAETDMVFLKFIFKCIWLNIKKYWKITKLEDSYFAI